MTEEEMIAQQLAEIEMRKARIRAVIVSLQIVCNKIDMLYNELNNLKSLDTENILIDEKGYKEDDINSNINMTKSASDTIRNSIIPSLMAQT